MSFPPTGFTTAWHNSGEFWVQTGMAVARHPLVVLVCAVVPAAERAYLLLEPRPIPAWKHRDSQGWCPVAGFAVRGDGVGSGERGEMATAACFFFRECDGAARVAADGNVSGRSSARGAVGAVLLCGGVSSAELSTGADVASAAVAWMFRLRETAARLSCRC